MKSYEKNPVVDLINTMMYVGGKSREEMAKCLDMTYGQFCGILRYKTRTKNGRTLDTAELIKVAEFCGFNLILERQGVHINLMEYVQGREEEEGDRNETVH